MEVFLHGAGNFQPRMIEVDELTTVSVVLASFGEEGEGLWIEEADVELDQEITLQQAGVHSHGHLHRHRCRRVDVVVRHIDQDRHREFSPAATVGRVLKWALGPEGFDIPEAERPEFGFLGCGDGKAVPDDVHVGSLTSPGQACEACLSLVKKVNPQG
jgi:hypothetical protein